MTTADALRAQIAELERQLELAEAAPLLRAWQLGDRVKVRADSRAGPKAPHIGDVGTIVAVSPKAEATTVYHNCLHRVYLLDFGPDADRYGGRDTWGYADGDLVDVDESVARPRRRKVAG